MANWPTVPIGSVAEIFDGPHATPKTVTAGPIFLGIGALQSGRITLGETRHVSAKDYKIWTRRVKPQPGDFVFSYETRIGEGALIPEGLECCLGRRMGLVRANRARLDPRFLMYLYLAPDFQDFLRSRTITGATVDRISLTEFPEFPIPLPPLAEQQALSSILGALDDKIDLNRRMNKTLETMARAIFKDWFVDFGPTRAKMEGRAAYLAPEIWSLFPDLLDNEGKPQGWCIVDIGSIGRVITGKTPTTAEPANFGGDFPFITIPDLDGRIYIDHVDRTLSEKGATAIKGSLLPPRSVMMSCIATVGRCGITTKPSFTNQQINSVICGHNIEPEYLYWAFRFIGDEVEQAGGGGSVYTNVSKSRFSSIRILLPPLKLQKLFIGPWFEKNKANIEENIVMAVTRDLLLPKLMSGGIRVNDAERIAEAAK